MGSAGVQSVDRIAAEHDAWTQQHDIVDRIGGESTESGWDHGAGMAAE
jgi:hypothetical protein